MICHQNWNSQLAILQTNQCFELCHIHCQRYKQCRQWLLLGLGAIWKLPNEFVINKAKVKNWVKKTYIPNLLETIGKVNHHLKLVQLSWYKVLHHDSCIKSYRLWQRHVKVKPYEYLKNGKGKVVLFLWFWC